MKKIFSLALLTVFFVSCQKEPDLSDMDGEFTVLTNFDVNADMSTASTFYIPDSILLVIRVLPIRRMLIWDCRFHILRTTIILLISSLLPGGGGIPVIGIRFIGESAGEDGIILFL